MYEATRQQKDVLAHLSRSIIVSLADLSSFENDCAKQDCSSSNWEELKGKEQNGNIYISGAEGVMYIYILYLYLYCYSISFFPPFNYVIPDSNGGKFSSPPFILGAVFFLFFFFSSSLSVRRFLFLMRC